MKILFSSNFEKYKYRQKFGIIKKNNKNLNPFENSRNISFGISLESKLFYLDLIKTKKKFKSI